MNMPITFPSSSKLKSSAYISIAIFLVFVSCVIHIFLDYLIELNIYYLTQYFFGSLISFRL